MGKYLIIIHEIPPSTNQFIGRNKRWQYAKTKKKWHDLVTNAITEKPPVPIKRAEVHIHYYFPNKRRRDPDNYAGKMIHDPLVQNGILADDSFNNVVLVLSADVDKADPRTVITITELE